MSSVATNTLPASIALPLQRRGDRIAFAELEQMLDAAATRHRDLQKEMNRGEAIQKETQQRDIARETSQRQTQQQHHDRATDSGGREARRSASVAFQNGVNKNAGAPSAPATFSVRANDTAAVASSVKVSSDPLAVAKLQGEFHEPLPLDISQSSPTRPTIVADAVRVNVSATLFGQPQSLSATPTTTPSAVAASTVFTVFSSRGKLRNSVDDDDTENDRSDDAASSAASGSAASANKSDVSVSSKQRGRAVELFAHLFPSPVSRGMVSQRRTEDDVLPREPAVDATPLQDVATSSQCLVPMRDEVADKVPEPSRQNVTVELIQRVVAALQSAANRGDTVRIRMHPESLGSVAVRVRIRDGKMSASLRVENETARTTLLSHRDALRNRLAERGISLEEFDVELF